MNKRNELIRRLCPDGVRYYALNEVSHYAKKRIDASEVNEATYVGVENLLQNKQGKTSASSVPTSGMVIAFEKGDILIGNIRPYLRKIWLSDCDGGTNGDVLVIQINKRELLCPKFLFYVLSSEDFFNYDNQNAKGAKMPRGDKSAVMKYRIPVPPLEVQREIVRILDNFTELTAELTAELIAELTARKKQYEYYKDQILNFNNTVPVCKIGEICVIKGRIGFRGYTKNDFVSEGTGALSLSPGNIVENQLIFSECKYITWEKYYESPEIMLSEGDIVLCKTGSTVGKVAIVDFLPQKATLNPQLVVLKDIKCNQRFLFYQLSKTDIQAKIKALAGIGSVPNISQKAIAEIEISIPNIETQDTIAKVLDRFEETHNSICKVLSAEINIKKKQYEYYRDKLLTFKQLA